MRVAELEAQIRATPDDVELRAVYADAVLERGEPGDRVRGQLIHLALRGERGDAAAAREAWSMQRKARARLVNALDRRYVLRLGWKHGSVESISLELRMWSGATSLHQARTTAALEDLFAAPEVFALRALDTRPAGDGHIETIVGLIEHLPLRWLGVAGAAITPKELARLRTLPHLDGLGVHTHEVDAVLALLANQPWLRDLELSTGLRGEHVERIIRDFPQLERLVLYGVDTRMPELTRIFEGALPALRDLGVMANVEVTEWMLRLLVDSPLLPRLRSLGLCAANLYDTEAVRDWLSAHRTPFAKLALFSSGFQPDHDRGHEAGRLGSLFETLGRTREGIDDWQHHLDHSGSDRVHAGCWGRLANALLQNEQHAEGLRAVDHGLEVMGDGLADTAYLLRTRMWALHLLERHAETVVAARRALTEEPKHAWTWRILGDGLVKLGRYDEAMPAYDRAVAEATQHDDLVRSHLHRGELRFGRRDDNPVDVERVLSIAEPVEYDVRRRALLLQGSLAYRRRDLEQARRCYVEALGDSHRSQPEATRCLIATLVELEQFPVALTTLTIAPTQYDGVRDDRAHVHVAAGNPAEALTLDPAYPMALHALGRTDEAIAALDDYAGNGDHVCAFRFAAGLLLQGLFSRASHPREAAKLFAKLRDLPSDPVELHAAIGRRLRGDSMCTVKTCARHATVAALAAAIATHDRGRTHALARAYAAYEDTQLAGHPALVWELRFALELLPSPVLAAALATLAYGAPTSGILDALD